MGVSRAIEETDVHTHKHRRTFMNTLRCGFEYEFTCGWIQRYHEKDVMVSCRLTLAGEVDSLQDALVSAVFYLSSAMVVLRWKVGLPLVTSVHVHGVAGLLHASCLT